MNITNMYKKLENSKKNISLIITLSVMVMLPMKLPPTNTKKALP